MIAGDVDTQVDNTNDLVAMTPGTYEAANEHFLMNRTQIWYIAWGFEHACSYFHHSTSQLASSSNRSISLFLVILVSVLTRKWRKVSSTSNLSFVSCCTKPCVAVVRFDYDDERLSSFLLSQDGRVQSRFLFIYLFSWNIIAHVFVQMAV